MRRLLPLAVAGVLLAACQGAGPEEAAPSPTPTTATPRPAPSATPDGADGVEGADVPPLAAPPEGDLTLWLDTVGVPVVAAVRTSTQLARLAGEPASRRAGTCRQVATDLDDIGSPQLLAGLAITADAETATLLVGDLRAKGDLLAACLAGGPELDERIAEVERTHAVAVAWLERLRGDG